MSSHPALSCHHKLIIVGDSWTFPTQKFHRETKVTQIIPIRGIFCLFFFARHFQFVIQPSFTVRKIWTLNNYFLKTITISQKHIWKKPSYFFFGWILGLVDGFFTQKYVIGAKAWGKLAEHSQKVVGMDFRIYYNMVK